jgi:hypothetical protein
MKCFGDLDMQGNLLQNFALEEVEVFPSNPVVGQWCFKSRIVYICAQIIGGIPTWIPLTNELSSFVHTQSVSAVEWIVQHNLGKDVIIQIIDSTGEIILPDKIINLDGDTASVRFLNAQQGKAICVAASNSGGIHTVTAHNHVQDTPSATWTIQHNLGYKPIVQVILSDLFQIIPSEIEHAPNNLTAYVRFSTPQSGTARCI